MNKARVNIIGPFPPPFGGISVHMQRIYSYLKNETVTFYNTSNLNFVEAKQFSKIKLFLLFFKFRQLIHYHSTSINIRLVLGFYALLNNKIYLHAHGASLTDQLKSKSWRSRLLKLVLPKVNIISSNSEIYDFIKSNYSPLTLHLFDAFIPPLYDDTLFNSVIKTIELPKSKYLISMTGWFSIYKDQDLYGYDIMLQTLQKLRAKNIDVSFVASVNGIANDELYNSFIAERDKLNLSNNFHLIMDDLPELYPVILASDIFVRPTNTDGNAVSIKEALWFQVPVIASDIVPRPAKVITFKNRMVDDLTNKIEKQLLSTSKKDQKRTVQNQRFEHPIIKEIYGFK